MKTIQLLFLSALLLTPTFINGQSVMTEWANSYHFPGLPLAYGYNTQPGLTAATDGGAYLTFWFSGALAIADTTLYIDSSPNPNCNIMIARVNALGDPLWVQKIGGVDIDQGSINNDIVFGIDVDQDNSLIIGGHFEGSIIFGNGADTLISSGAGDNWDGFIAKYDSSGTFLWADKVGGYSTGNHDDDLHALRTTPDGGVIAVGHFADSCSFGDTTIFATNGNNSDGYVVKYDTNGIVSWYKILSSSEDTQVNDVDVDGNGNINLTVHQRGSTNLGDTTVTNPSGTPRVMVVQVNPTGGTNWVRMLSPSQSWGGKITTDALGFSYVYAHFNSQLITTDTTFLNGNWSSSIRSVVMKYSPNGTEQWVRRLNMHVYGMDSDDQGVYLNGSSLDSAQIGTEIVQIVHQDHFNAILAFMDEQGNTQWVKQIRADNEDNGATVSVNNHGDLFYDGHLGNDPNIAIDTITLPHHINQRYYAKIGFRLNGVTVQNNPCGVNGNASITLFGTGGEAPFQYSIDGGLSYVSTSVFTGLINGSYPIAILDNNGLVLTDNAVVNSAVVMIDTTVTHLNDSLIATPGYDNYEWIDCATGNMLTSGPSTFHVTSSGSYSVQITDGACSLASSCINVIITSVNETPHEAQIEAAVIADDLVIRLPDTPATLYLELMDLTGKTVRVLNKSNGPTTRMSLAGLSSGVYLLSGTINGNGFSQRISY